jgi:hypothetical protein
MSPPPRPFSADPRHGRRYEDVEGVFSLFFCEDEEVLDSEAELLDDEESPLDDEESLLEEEDSPADEDSLFSFASRARRLVP